MRIFILFLLLTSVALADPIEVKTKSERKTREIKNWNKDVYSDNLNPKDYKLPIPKNDKLYETMEQLIQ